MTDKTTIKAAARKDAFAARKAAHGAELDTAANGELLRLVKASGATVVSGYMPIRTEISPIATMTALHEQGLRICVPVIEDAAQPLMFRQWSPDATMVDGPFGAVVPETGDWLEPDLLITPLLRFDRAGYRLGYGGGFYDRTFEMLRARRPTLGVGFAYGVQEMDEVPIEPTDQKLDAVVTEAGVIGISPRGIALAGQID